MQIGFASGDITPAPGPVLQGHWSNQPSTQVLYPLEVRAMAMEQAQTRAAIVTLDVIGLRLPITQRIREGVADLVPGEAVMVAPSHTHCAPAVLEGLGHDPDPAYMDRIVETCIKAIRDAFGHLREATLGIGGGAAHFGINRRPLPGHTGMMPNYGGIIDRRVRVLRCDDSKGQPLGVLFHFSCHPTTLPGNLGLISPDYPGIARTLIEDKLGCPAMYMPGCFANIRPAIINDSGTGFAHATREQLDACGHELGNEVVRVANWLQTREATKLSAKCIELDLPYGDTVSAEQLEAWANDDKSHSAKIHQPWAKRILDLQAKGQMPEVRHTEMQRLTVGPVAMVTIPGEPAQEIGHALEKRYRTAIGCEDLWPVGYTNDMVGYLSTRQQYKEGGYEPNAFPYYGDPAGFRDEELIIEEAAGRLV